jgi:two-component system cell cycle response regulator CtrA
MRVLLVTADPAVRQLAGTALAAAGLTLAEAVDGEEALTEARAGDPDLVLIDDGVAAMSPAGLVRRLRRTGVAAGVILLGDRIDAAGRARALDLGADDCVGRAIDPAELLARVRAVVRRAAGHASCLLKVGGLSLDIAARTVSVGRATVRITGKEFDLLELLALRRGRVVSRASIMDHLYGGVDGEPLEKVVDIHVCRIRRKLAAATPGGEALLRTVWGRGFMLREAEPAVRTDRLAA